MAGGGHDHVEAVAPAELQPGAGPQVGVDQGVFELHGIDVTTRSIVALKSSQHFRAGFRHLATGIVTADGPGLTTLDVTVFDHVRSPGPVWPHDPSMTWSP
ncbi:MAG: MlrC C-terminal domain-containing protein [Actinomycetota bacterium]